jgi:hypothetical protein
MSGRSARMTDALPAMRGCFNRMSAPVAAPRLPMGARLWKSGAWWKFDGCPDLARHEQNDRSDIRLDGLKPDDTALNPHCERSEAMTEKILDRPRARVFGEPNEKEGGQAALFLSPRSPRSRRETVPRRCRKHQ